MAHRPTILGRSHAISAGHYLAAEIGFAVLQDGGNAFDSAIAACIALGVVQSDIVSIGGVLPMMLRLGDSGKVISVSGAGTWPRAASREIFEAEFGDQIPLGILRTVVPAAPDAWFTVLELFGTRSFAELAAPSIDLARNGFPMYPLMSENIGRWADQLRAWPSSEAMFLPGGAPPAVGSIFVQTDLADTLQFIADEETSASAKGGREAGLRAARHAFYKGDIARRIIDFQQSNGGLLQAADLSEYQTRLEEPVRIETMGRTVYTCGPWTQGPMLIQILQIMEQIGAGQLGHNSSDYLHVLTETIKLAASDREAFYGDPNFVDVPLPQLLSKSYAADRAGLIKFSLAHPHVPEPGLDKGRRGSSVTADGEPAVARDTSYVCVSDRHGNVVSATPSDEAVDCPITPGLGFLVSSRGSQSWIQKGHPSAIAAGKRPRLTPNPALAVRDDREFLAFGCPGGDMQVQAMVQAFLNHVVFGMDLQDAVEASRIGSYGIVQSFSPHEIYPGLLKIDPEIPEHVARSLSDRGHAVERWEKLSYAAGSVCMLAMDARTGSVRAAADPRRPSYALGW